MCKSKFLKVVSAVVAVLFFLNSAFSAAPPLGYAKYALRALSAGLDGKTPVSVAEGLKGKDARYQFHADEVGVDAIIRSTYDEKRRRGTITIAGITVEDITVRFKSSKYTAGQIYVFDDLELVILLSNLAERPIEDVFLPEAIAELNALKEALRLHAKRKKYSHSRIPVINHKIAVHFMRRSKTRMKRFLTPSLIKVYYRTAEDSGLGYIYLILAINKNNKLLPVAIDPNNRLNIAEALSHTARSAIVESLPGGFIESALWRAYEEQEKGVVKPKPTPVILDDNPIGRIFIKGREKIYFPGEILRDIYRAVKTARKYSIGLDIAVHIKDGVAVKVEFPKEDNIAIIDASGLMGEMRIYISEYFEVVAACMGSLRRIVEHLSVRGDTSGRVELNILYLLPLQVALHRLTKHMKDYHIKGISLFSLSKKERVKLSLEDISKLASRGVGLRELLEFIENIKGVEAVAEEWAGTRSIYGYDLDISAYTKEAMLKFAPSDISLDELLESVTAKVRVAERWLLPPGRDIIMIRNHPKQHYMPLPYYFARGAEKRCDTAMPYFFKGITSGMVVYTEESEELLLFNEPDDKNRRLYSEIYRAFHNFGQDVREELRAAALKAYPANVKASSAGEQLTAQNQIEIYGAATMPLFTRNFDREEIASRAAEAIADIIITHVEAQCNNALLRGRKAELIGAIKRLASKEMVFRGGNFLKTETFRWEEATIEFTCSLAKADILINVDIISKSYVNAANPLEQRFDIRLAAPTALLNEAAAAREELRRFFDSRLNKTAQKISKDRDILMAIQTQA